MRFFVCQAVPNEYIEKYNVSQAATTFCFDLIDNDCFDKTLSLIPINIKDDIKKHCKHYKTEFIQCRLLPHNKFFRGINNIFENITIIRKGLKAKTIWFYNITLTNLLAVLILKFILFKKVYAIIADFNPPMHIISIDNIIKFTVENLNGVISLSTRGDFSNRNQSYIAGIIPTSKINKIQTNLNFRKFLFSGVLNKVKGVEKAIDVFSKIPDAELIISGRGDKELPDKIKPYKNIKYLGFLSQKEYEKVFSDITFCLNFRNPALPENNNNFPSKILEYFFYNKIVISTIEYPELSKFKYYYIPYDLDSIILLINKLLTIDTNKLKNYCNHSEQLKQHFSEHKWAYAFLDIENEI